METSKFFKLQTFVLFNSFWSNNMMNLDIASHVNIMLISKLLSTWSLCARTKHIYIEWILTATVTHFRRNLQKFSIYFNKFLWSLWLLYIQDGIADVSDTNAEADARFELASGLVSWRQHAHTAGRGILDCHGQCGWVSRNHVSTL